MTPWACRCGEYVRSMGIACHGCGHVWGRHGVPGEQEPVGQSGGLPNGVDQSVAGSAEKQTAPSAHFYPELLDAVRTALAAVYGGRVPEQP